MNEALAKDQLVSELQLRQSQLDAQQLGVRNEIAKEQLATRAESSARADRGAAVDVDQARAVLQLKRRQRDELQGPRRH